MLFVEREGFNSNEEAELTRKLLADPTAKPLLSLLAFVENHPAGHILFTKAQFANDKDNVSVSFLAPFAVLPRFQKQGIGGNLIKKGFKLLSKSGVDLIFVVGHPKYYPRFGFKPAAKFGFEPTYPIPERVADAWRVKALRPDIIGAVSGKVFCCDTLNKPGLWRG
jgi:putative acetyltransferase